MRPATRLVGGERPAYVSAFELFRVGIGPSSSHTVGPMRAAREVMIWGYGLGLSSQADRLTCDLYGSLALTGVGHSTDKAVILGLAGETPGEVDPDRITAIVGRVRSRGTVAWPDGDTIAFDPAIDLRFRKKEFLPGHPNALRFEFLKSGSILAARTFYSIGGGFIQVEGASQRVADRVAYPYEFESADRLLELCARDGLTLADAARSNERILRDDVEIDLELDRIWGAMRACVGRGIRSEGMLPGGLAVKRRAAALHSALVERDLRDQGDPLRAMEWVNLYALAVNEENAAGGRVVTAPTNGAAGIIPAVIHYYDRFVDNAGPDRIRVFLLTAAAIGAIIKRNASISGADVGCQGEVGSAAAMAAAGLAAALGGTNAQIENAAEIALEHSLGLTCDPVGGLVQVPCIERNAVGAVKAVNAARLALHGDGTHRVSLDQAIETMRQTGRDMKRKYKETSLGGLAVNVPLC
ncbi:MAG: L-serine ammonia-lyase [Beijerinckiaceae bacterium]